MKERHLCLATLSAVLADGARRLAAEKNFPRAMRALALAEVLHHAAENNRTDKRLALIEAKFLGRAERRSRMLLSKKEKET